jgi:hypothetical protein
MKSIIIFGKGPSVSNCTREMVNQCDDIAICNYPVLNDFFTSLITDKKIKYHFANCGTFDKRYTYDVNEKLNIEQIINTNYFKSNKYINFLKKKELFTHSIREKYEIYFKNNFDLDPNSGIMGLQFLIDTGEYDKILLVGFDNYKIGEQVYYYPINDINKSLNYLIGKNIITKEGNFNIISSHNPEKTENYLNSLHDKYQNIKIKRL